MFFYKRGGMSPCAEAVTKDQKVDYGNIFIVKDASKDEKNSLSM